MTTISTDNTTNMTTSTPFHVLIIHTLEDFQPDQPLPSLRILRLIPGIRHLNFVFRVRNNQFDRLRLPWHFIRSIKKCQHNPLHLKLKLYATKWYSPAFQSILPVYYFPNFEGKIIVKFCDQKDRHDFVRSLILDGLILKNNLKLHKFAPQTLKYKWKFLYIPRRIDDDEGDQEQGPSHEEVASEKGHQLTNIEEEQGLLKERSNRSEDSKDEYYSAIGHRSSEDDNSVEAEDDYYSALDEDVQNSVKSENEAFYFTAVYEEGDFSVKGEEEDDYLVVDEEESLNYPRIVFECGLDRAAIRPLKSKCSTDRAPKPTCGQKIQHCWEYLY